MPDPTAHDLELRAAEARAIAEQMRDRGTMANLALSYDRLAKHAAMREANEAVVRYISKRQSRDRSA
jgi:hypothetical protein